MRISKKELKLAYSSSSARVIEASRKKLKEIVGFNVLGCYNWEEKLYIRNNLPNYKKLLVFYHELKHYFCYKNKCLFCSIYKKNANKINYKKGEIQAIEYTLSRLLKEKRYQLLDYSIKDIKETGKLFDPKDEIFSNAFYLGSKQVVKRKLFKKCVSICRKNRIKIK